MEKPQARDQTCGAVVPLLLGDAPGVRRRLPLVDQRGRIACLDTEASVQSVLWQGLTVRGSGTQTGCGDEALAVRVVLAPLGHQACGRRPFAIIVADCNGFC